MKLTNIAKTIGMFIPAIAVILLLSMAMSDYQKPVAREYTGKADDVTRVEEVLAEKTAAMEAEKKKATRTAKKEAESEAKGVIDLEDGEYEGSANGFGGRITVRVTVKDKAITAIDIVSAPGETEPFFSRAKGVIDSILSSQSADVDTVSGATYSSRGIIVAVKNALYGTESTAAPVSNGVPSGNGPKDVGKVDESGEYKDGTYTGSARGFGGKIKVEVTIKKGKIKSVKILSASGETSSYLNKAKALLKRIVAKQTTNLSAVSGATYSSNGIIKAVRNALAKAKKASKKTDKKKKKTDTGKKKKKKKKSRKKPVKTTDPATWKDGTYTGTGIGFGGEIKVQVTIKDGKITAIKVLDASKETKKFFDKAVKILDDMIAAQSPDVDVVSGATYSSNGLIEAVSNALAKAVQKTDNNKDDPGQKDQDKESSSSTEKPEDKTDGEEQSSTEKAPEGTTQAGNPEGNTGEEGGTDSTQSPEATTEEKPEDNYRYKDGIYRVSATVYDVDEDFYDYTISMSVTIKADRITDISSVSISDSSNKPFVDDCKSLINKIISRGSADGVGAVSGATCTSDAIIQACGEAFSQAAK